MLRVLLVVAVVATARQPAATLRYFGFGSNVDTQLMRRRIGSEPLSAEPALVKGYRLAFTAAMGIGPGMGSLEPASQLQRECHGVLYTLTVEQMARLLASEGVPLAYSLINVRCMTYGGVPVSAAALRANGFGNIIESAMGPIRPSERYINLIRAGARDSGLTDEWQAYLATIKPFGR